MDLSIRARRTKRTRNDKISKRAKHKPILTLFERIIPFSPAANSPVHGKNIGVTHFLQIVGCQSGTIAAATVENDLGDGLRNLLFDVALDYSLAQENGSRQMVFGPFAFLAHIDQMKLFSTVQFCLHLVHAKLVD